MYMETARATHGTDDLAEEENGSTYSTRYQNKSQSCINKKKKPVVLMQRQKRRGQLNRVQKQTHTCNHPINNKIAIVIHWGNIIFRTNGVE